MIQVEDKGSTVHLIKEAMSSGASLDRCCEVLEINIRTYFRWIKSNSVKDKRKGSIKNIPRKLTKAEEDEIVRLCCSELYKDLNPYLIYISLLESGQSSHLLHLVSWVFC